MAEIKDVRAREILDSRGIPTVEAEVVLVSNVIGLASVPSGASTGINEAVELRDGDEKRFAGKGVLKAINHIETEIKNALLGHDVRHQKGIDEIMIQLDGTPNKERLGANAILAVSIASARAASKATKMPFFQYLQHGQPEHPTLLPVPMMNIINGGAHADNTLDVQEFMIMPVGAPTFKEALRYGAEIFHVLKSLLKQRNFNTAVGDEGGFAPNLPTTTAALDFILEAIHTAGFKPGKEIFLALDFASSEFYENGQYVLKGENKSFDSENWVAHCVQLVDQYPILSLEDAMSEEDWRGWKLLTDTLGDRLQLVGDDLFVTNPNLLMRGIRDKIANAILVKPNQIGTLTETTDTIKMAKAANIATIMSHRSGETEDTLIAALAIASQTGQIKTGAVSRSERTAKYNELLRIEEALATEAQYAGKVPYKGKTQLEKYA